MGERQGGAATPDGAAPANTVGILAGLGPLAGAAFYQHLVRATPARDDGEHLGVVLISDPALPDRAEHLLGQGPSPLPGLALAVDRLQAAGAELVAIPSATTHAYFDDLQSMSALPMVNLLEAVGAAVVGAGASSIGILATDVVVRLRLYERYLPPECRVLYPDPDSQRELQQVIAGVKKGSTFASLGAVPRALTARPWADGADVVLLGCTELHLLRDYLDGSARYLDATDLLARAVLTACGRAPLPPPRPHLGPATPAPPPADSGRARPLSDVGEGQP